MQNSLILAQPLSAATNVAPARRTFSVYFPLILSALLLFWFGGTLLQWLQPAAAIVDAGILSLVLLAVLCLLVFMALSSWLLGLLWPVLRDYRKYYFQKNFKILLPWQKLLFYMSAFFLLLYAFVCCLMAVL